MTYAIIVLFGFCAVHILGLGMELQKEDTSGTSLFLGLGLAILSGTAGGYLCYLAAQ